MATKTKPRRSEPDSGRRNQLVAGVRQLWVLLPGAKPTEVSSARRDLVGKATRFCWNGDTEWRPISELHFNDEEAT